MEWLIRKSGERGHFDHGWLKTWHSFSFSQYWDRKWMGFRSLRVINEDIVAPGEGFDPHPHDNMEIITVILEGELKHQDSMGNGSVIRPGDLQRMSAGTGVTHSEFNASSQIPVHLLQIWIIPSQEGIKPSYEQKHLAFKDRRDRLLPVAIPADEGLRQGRSRDSAIVLHQDACIYASVLSPAAELVHSCEKPRYYWLQVVSGKLRVNGVEVSAGDAAYTPVAHPARREIALTAVEESQFLLFELA